MQPQNDNEIKISDDIENGTRVIELLNNYYVNCHGQGLNSKDLDEKQFNSLLDLLKPMISLAFIGDKKLIMDDKCWYIKQLSRALQSPHCKLISLRLLSINTRDQDQGIQYLQPLDQGIQYLSEALQSPHCKLVSLELSRNKIGVQDIQSIQYLSEALQSQHCQLISLNLSTNILGDQGVQYLSQALKSPFCKLVALDLTANSIQDQGMQYLSQALQSPYCKLANLNLSDNDIGDQGIQYLSQALVSPNCQLTSINLFTQLTFFTDPISSKALELFAQSLNSPYSKLTSMIISPSCFSKSDAIESLIEAAQNNHKLTNFKIIFCDLECFCLTCPLLICLIGACLMYCIQTVSNNRTNSISEKIQPFVKRNQSLLIDCCDFLKTGQWKHAKELLDKGVSANNAMLKMAAAGQLQAIQWLLQNSDAQINIFDSNIQLTTLATLTHNTPLHLAAAWGHLDIVKWLVTHGAKIAPNNENLSPLDLAIKNKRPKVAGFLKDFIINSDQFSNEEYQAEKQPEISQLHNNIEEKHQYRADNTFAPSTPFANNLPASYLQPQTTFSTFFQTSSSTRDEQKTIELGIEHKLAYY